MFLWHAKINLLCRRRAIIAYGTATFTGEYAKLPPKRNPLQVLCAINLMTLFSLLLCVVCVCEGRPPNSLCYSSPSKLLPSTRCHLSYFCSLKLCSCINNQPKKLIVWNGSRPRKMHLGLARWNIFDKTLDLIGPPHSVKTRPNSLKKGRWLFLQPSTTKVISFLCQNFSFAIPKRRHTSIIGER